MWPIPHVWWHTRQHSRPARTTSATLALFTFLGTWNALLLPLITVPVDELLQTRNGPYPAGAQAAGRPDPRLRTPFAAAWIVAATAVLAELGVEAITAFAVSGLHGVVDGQGNPFPVYRAVRALCSGRSDRLIPVLGDDKVAVIAFRGSSGLRIVIASLDDRAADIAVKGISGRPSRVEGADFEPRLVGRELHLRIPPFEVVEIMAS